MQVIVESKNLTITEALRLHVHRQARKLEKLQKNITAVRVYLETIAKKRNDPSANDVTFYVDLPGQNIAVRKRAVDMYDAIVQAAEGAARSVRKAAEKQLTKHRLKAAEELSTA